MTTDARREALERAQEIADAFGYTAVSEQNRRLLARLAAQEAAPVGVPTSAERARELRALVWSRIPEELTTGDDTAAIALAALEQVREAQQVLATWANRLMRIAAENGASNPEIGARVGVGKNAIRKRLLKEPAGS